MLDVKCVVKSDDRLGEGPVWSAREGRLYWFDIKGMRLAWYEPATDDRGAFSLPMRASAAAPRAAGGLLIATEKGLAVCDPQAETIEIVAPFELEPGFRTNDGKIDVAGRLWWSTMDDRHGERPGALYRTDPDGRTHKVLEGLHIANTVSCSPDGRTMYLADSKVGALWAFPIQADGSLGERRMLADMAGEAHGPDGSAVDAEGYVWNVQWGGWRAVRYAPDGGVDRVVALPAQNVTSAAFGGPDLATLYVTSARDGLSEADLAGQPLAGALFAFEPDVAGLPLPAFVGEIGGR